MDNIVLIGFMGCGKSTIGKSIAAHLNMNFIDTDIEIEKLDKMTIQEIFNTKGEEHFRNLETAYLKAFKGENNVIATGGGMVMRPDNVEMLKKIGTVVFLHANYEHLISNLKEDSKRPLLQGENVEERIKNLLEKRESHYLGAADLILQASDKDISSIVKEILALILIH